VTAKRIATRTVWLALMAAQACTPAWDSTPTRSQTSYASVDVGNAASLPGNAGALPGNASSLPGNASSLPGNASSLPGNGATIISAESNAWMVKPRATAAATCGSVALSKNWEFASSYRCGGSGRIHTSDIAINGANLGASFCSSCGGSAPSRMYLPATLSNVDRSVTVDVVLAIDFAGPSVYDCGQDDYAVMVYDLSISQDNCQTFSTPDRVTAMPAPQHMFAGAQGLSPVGDGWGLLVPATTSSAVFKAAHYTKMVTTFYPERSNAWKFNYPTTNVPCGQPGSSCLSGASMVLGYGLALANLAPIDIGGTIYGVAGTVTGVPTWLSILTATGVINRTYLEVGAAVVPNSDVLPGVTEKSRTPYQYDAVFGPSTHLFSSARAAFGPNHARVDLAREAFCGNLESCENDTAQAALFVNYGAGMAASPATNELKIQQLFGLVAGSSPFIVTAMPEPGATASCSPTQEHGHKRTVDVPGPTFCLGGPGPGPSPTPTPDAGVDGGSGPDASTPDAGGGSGSDAGSDASTPDAGNGSDSGSGSGSDTSTPDAGNGSDSGSGSGSDSTSPDAGIPYSGSGSS
jgi:hypothetical protein